MIKPCLLHRRDAHPNVGERQGEAAAHPPDHRPRRHRLRESEGPGPQNDCTQRSSDGRFGGEFHDFQGFQINLIIFFITQTTTSIASLVSKNAPLANR